MKKILLTTALIITCITCKLYAQPQWKFHIAFEDATGAKDTIWLIYDITATGNLVDSALGEGPAITDASVFNVWFYNVNFDSTKTWAIPYNYKTQSVEIRAFNVIYPMLIRWDTALYNSPVLPSPFNFGRIDNGYFFGVNNHPSLQAYDPMLTDSAYCPPFSWGSQQHFPLGFLIERDHIYGGIPDLHQKIYNLFPMPFNDYLSITGKENIEEIDIIDMQGKILTRQVECNQLNEFKLLTQTIPQGIYILKITNNLKQIHYEKIIKNN